MALLLQCDSCKKQMKTLEEHKISSDNKYLCLRCSQSSLKDPIKEFYDGLDEDTPFGYIGFHKKPEYRHFLGKFNFIGTTTHNNFYRGITNCPVNKFDSVVDVFQSKKYPAIKITCGYTIWYIHTGFNIHDKWSSNFDESFIIYTLANY